MKMSFFFQCIFPAMRSISVIYRKIKIIQRLKQAQIIIIMNRLMKISIMVEAIDAAIAISHPVGSMSLRFACLFY